MRLLPFAFFLSFAAGCSVLYPLDYRTAAPDATVPDGPASDAAPDTSTHPPCPANFDRCTGAACMDLRTNTDHCGRCNNVCALDNGTAACEMGRCVVATCNPGYGDCDGDAANGCEANTQGSATHCGRCGNACSAASGSFACREGVCRVTACAAGFADCDGNDVTGCETDTRATLAHCGGCGMACAPRANAAALCRAGACAYECNAGFADCDGDPTNGCEADTRASTAHCGMCNRACSATGGTASCLMGTCALECSRGRGDCDANVGNGCERDLLTDGAHCGMCGRVCATGTTCINGVCTMGGCPAGQVMCAGGCVDVASNTAHCGACNRACATGANAVATCVGGNCRITCAAGFGNCNADPADGCETPVTTPFNCGMCANRCPTPTGTTATCAAGSCGITCVAGRGDCDLTNGNGCEVNLESSVVHCGACNRTCSAPNARPACRGGACAIDSCSGGFGDCNGMAVDGCEVNTQSNVMHCGACNRVCRLPNATASCAAGQCRVAMCNAGFRDCDNDPSNGCEVNVANNIESCGACGVRCAPGAACGSNGCCGAPGMTCCQPGNTCLSSGLAEGRCVSGRCVAPCGGEGQFCCLGGSPCLMGLTCRLGFCRR